MIQQYDDWYGNHSNRPESWFIKSDSVEKTVDIMTRVKFDLFLLDISLEHENDGYYLAQIIREEDPLVPIIFLSGKKNEEDIITGLEMGGDYYITKPFCLTY